MNKKELYASVKSTILSTPWCPDGSGSPKMACPSCLAEAVAESLAAQGLIDETSSD